MYVYACSQLGTKYRQKTLHIYNLNTLDISVKSIVQCATNKLEVTEEGLSPWLFSWHDHGWMSASVRRGLENIKGRGNKQFG